MASAHRPAWLARYIGPQSIIIKIAGTSDQITLLNTMDNSSNYDRIEQVRFADGTSWTHAQLFAMATLPTNGNDNFYAGPEAATLSGEAGDDTLVGAAGNDTLVGGASNDALYGGAGSDTFLVGLDSGFDAVDGGSGTDTILATAAGTVIGLRSLAGVEAISANGHAGVRIEGSANADTLNFASVTLTGIDRIDGGGGNDTITGNTIANVIWGGTGDDLLRGNGGADTIDGGVGLDKALFAGTRASYTITTLSGSIQVVDNAPASDGDDGTDTLIATEQAVFRDQTVSLAAPIVLDLDGDGINLIDLSGSDARFDFDGDGIRDPAGWIGPGDGFLVFDRNGDGRVSDASELSFVNDRAGALSDLDGLRAFDSNGDGFFSSLDEQFDRFLVWQDLNGDGAVGKKEMLTLPKAGVAAIDLTADSVDQGWAWGSNITINTGEFIRTNGSRSALADVALIYQASSVAQPADVSPLPSDVGAELQWARFPLDRHMLAPSDGHFELIQKVPDMHGLSRTVRTSGGDAIVEADELRAPAELLKGRWFEAPNTIMSTWEVLPLLSNSGFPDMHIPAEGGETTCSDSALLWEPSPYSGPPQPPPRRRPTLKERSSGL